ncbi:MAG: hypothetical protein K0U98_01805 [Deltaproteobacteria bacterium]|nr:hypothetical protein [Deltaproteobacteria bacterium]
MIETLLALGAVYVAVGLIFTLIFHLTGLSKVDPGVKGAGFLFRLLITPGLIALWPALALKWRRAARGLSVVGEAESPVSSGGLRSFHRLLICLLALLLPLAVGAGWASRQGPPPIEKSLLDGAPELAGSRMLDPLDPFEGFPIDLTLRSQGEAVEDPRRQVELSIAKDLEVPSLALFWVPTPQGEGLSREAVYLGAVWGPATLRYELPGREGGALVLYSLAHQKKLASRAL